LMILTRTYEAFSTSNGLLNYNAKIKLHVFYLYCNTSMIIKRGFLASLCIDVSVIRTNDTEIPFY
jgi:hypothetical protein